MQDMIPREMSRPHEFSYRVSEGQPCFNDCKGHFEHCGCYPNLYCTACGREASEVEAIANAALSQFYDKHLDLQAALRIVNNFKAHCKSERTSSAVHRALNLYDGVVPGK